MESNYTGKPTEPHKLTKLTKSIEFSKLTKHTKPIELIEPFKPIELIELIEPFEPFNNLQPGNLETGQQTPLLHFKISLHHIS